MFGNQHDNAREVVELVEPSRKILHHFENNNN